jgi:hypothetical protein
VRAFRVTEKDHLVTLLTVFVEGLTKESVDASQYKYLVQLSIYIVRFVITLRSLDQLYFLEEPVPSHLSTLSKLLLQKFASLPATYPSCQPLFDALSKQLTHECHIKEFYVPPQKDQRPS